MSTKLEKIKIYLSEDRLNQYCSVANHNFKKALYLYQQDIKYCRKMYTALNLFEVILRNAINIQLTNDFGEDWFNNKKINFNSRQLELIKKVKFAIIEENKQPTNSNIITKLTFGFWCNLFNPQHDKILWRTSLCKIFNNIDKLPKRGLIRKYLESLRGVRNRVSHCESIIKYPIEKYYNNLLGILNWIDKDVAYWVKKEVKFK